jgi:hypothetical protein
MSNDPTGYYSAMRDADDALQDALAAIRAQEDAHRITPAEAAAERVGVLERHLAECQRLRRDLLGGE